MKEEKMLPPNPMALIISYSWLMLNNDSESNRILYFHGDISYDGLGMIKWWIPDEAN